MEKDKAPQDTIDNIHWKAFGTAIESLPRPPWNFIEKYSMGMPGMGNGNNGNTINVQGVEILRMHPMLSSAVVPRPMTYGTSLYIPFRR
jgi:hypothetical protein